jgi:hypothetical protein
MVLAKLLSSSDGSFDTEKKVSTYKYGNVHTLQKRRIHLILAKVDAIRNQHTYVSSYVSAKSGKMWLLEKKKKVQAALQ